MISDQLLDRLPMQDQSFDEVTGRVFSQPRQHRWLGVVQIVGVSDGPNQAGASGPGRRAPA